MNDKNPQQGWGSPFDTPAHWSLKMGPIINSQNKSVYLTVLWMLGTITIISLAGIISLSFLGKEIPQALIALPPFHHNFKIF